MSRIYLSNNDRKELEEAKSELTPSQRLTELAIAKNKEVRKAVTVNPNTPENVLLNLGREFPEEFLDNPVLPLLLIEDPKLYEKISVKIIRVLMKRDDLSENLKEFAVNRFSSRYTTDIQVLLAIAMNSSIPKCLLEKLISAIDKQPVNSNCNYDVYHSVKETVKLHVNLNEEVTVDCDYFVSQQIKYHIDNKNRSWYNWQSTIKQKLLWDLEVISEEYLPALDNLTLIEIIQNTHTSENILDKVFDFIKKYKESKKNKIYKWEEEYIKEILQIIASHQNAPKNILEELIESPDYQIRDAAVNNSKIPLSAIQILEKKVLALRNSNTSSEVIAQLARNESKYIKIGAALHPNTPEYILSELAQTDDSQILIAVLINPNTSHSILSKIIENNLLKNYFQREIGENFISEILAFHWEKYDFYQMLFKGFSNSGSEVINIRQTSVKADEIIVGHPSITKSELKCFLPFRSLYINQILATHNLTSKDTLSYLIKNGNEKVVEAVLQNPDLPEDIYQQILAKYSDESTRKKVLQQKQLTEKEKVKLREQIAEKRLHDFFSHIVQEIVDKLNHIDILYIPHPLIKKLDSIQKYLFKYSHTEYLFSQKILNLIKNNSLNKKSKILEDLRIEYENLSSLLKSASNFQTSSDTLIKLIEYPEGSVGNLVSENAVKTLYQKIILSNDISDDIFLEKNLEKIIELNNSQLNLALARSLKIPAKTLEKLTKHSNTEIGRIIAENPNANIAVLEKLTEHSDRTVRKVAFDNLSQRFSHHVYENNFLQEWKALQDILHNISYNYQQLITVEIEAEIESLANSKWLLIREAIAQNENTPIWILEKLSTDRRNAVRAGVARNPNTPVECLQWLSKNKSPEVLHSLTDNPSIPLNILQKLAYNSVWKNPLHIASVKAIWRRFPNAASVFLQRYIPPYSFFYHRSPKNYKHYLLSDFSIARVCFLLHPHLPQEILEKHHLSYSWLERYAIAKNPNTPQRIRKKLANDGNKIVRTAASAFFE